jgi:hypothetical protein
VISRYPAHLAETLVIDRSWSYCGACGRGAFPDQDTHADVAGWFPEPAAGCGVRWTSVTSMYFDAKDDVVDMRPDLAWIEPFASTRP